MERRRLLVLSPYPTGHVPGQRFRIEQWEGVLEDLGISCTYVPFADRALGTFTRWTSTAPKLTQLPTVLLQDALWLGAYQLSLGLID